LVKRNIGKNWNQLYQKEFGSLMDFAKSHKDFFEVDGTEVKLKDARYQTIPVEQFDVELRRVSAETDHSGVSGEGREGAEADPLMDADAALAAQLHEAELQASLGKGSVAEAADVEASEEWQSTDKKKKNTSRKQKNKEKAKAAASGTTASPARQGSSSGTPSKSAGSEAVATASTSGKVQPAEVSAPSLAAETSESSATASQVAAAAEEEEKEDEAVELLAQTLLNAFHGSFFCFNDSEVKPICITDLRNSYEGRSSAYLLIYRRCEDDAWDGNGGEMKTSVSVTMNPPTLWHEQVQARNRELQQKRLEYENCMHSVKLTVYFPVHLTNTWPCVSLVDPEDLVSMGFLQPSLAKGLVVECDISKGLKVLREDILSKALTALGDADIATILGGEGDVSISKLQPLTTPAGPKNASSSSGSCKVGTLYFMGPGLAASEAVGDTLSHNGSIVLWSALHLPNGSGDIELMTSAPRSLTVCYKSEPSGQMATTGLYIPSATTMADLCRIASEAIGLSPNQVQVHTLQERKVLYQTKTSGGKWKEWFATPMWKPSSLTKAFALQSQRYSQMEWEEVIVENVGSAKPSASSLANKEVIRRNRLRSIRVELDLGGSTMTRLLQDYAKGGALFPAEADEDGMTQSPQDKGKLDAQAGDGAAEGGAEELSNTTAKLEVDQNITVLELKLMALESFGFGSWVAEASRLRTGLNIGDGLLTAESLSITDAGLMEGAALSLELTSTTLAADDVVTLRYCHVTGNDIAVKHNPKQPGSRGSECTIEVKNGDTLQLAREKMLEASEVRVVGSCPHTRLRGTNWAGECGELLEEMDVETNELVTVGEAISSGKLKAGDLLLVEEGRVPIKGHLNIKVNGYLCSEPMLYLIDGLCSYICGETI
jgi:hypothetical protein